MSLRDQWCRLVEEVAGMNSRAALPREYAAADYLPARRPLPPALLDHIRAGADAFDAASSCVFHPQMTPEEGYHAKPSLAPPAQTQPEAERERARDAEWDGPNFFEAYRTHAVGARRARRDGIATTAALRSLGSASRLASGFLLPEYYAEKHRQPDFIPTIIVPASVSAVLQLFNVRAFLERGVYVDPSTLFVEAETGAVNVQESKPDNVIVTPGSFLDAEKYTVAYKLFRVVDDPKQVKNWQHVCACFVDGSEWQFNGWFPNEQSPVPVSELFQRVCGFLPYMEEEKLPKALQQWRVKPLPLTRRVVKAHAHILQASVFWEHLYTFLETHPFFKLYTVPLD